MLDRIAKNTLNVILLIDTSKSMSGNRIKQVNDAVTEIKDYLKGLQVENTQVDFNLTLIPFATNATFYNNSRSVNVDDLYFEGLKAGGQTNLHLAYNKLEQILVSERQGGIMPDFGGLAPIILLLSDGHPTKPVQGSRINRLKKLPWFNYALKFAVAIGLNDEKTMKNLRNFTGNKETVLHCLDSDALKEIIKIIVVTSSLVKSNQLQTPVKTESEIQQEIINTIHESIDEVVDWGW